MADQGPQKVGAYERPARTKGWIIGGVVLLVLWTGTVYRLTVHT